MAVGIACRACGFLYGFADDGVEYLSPACPACGAADARIGVEIDSADGPHSERTYLVADRLGRSVAGPFGSAAAAIRWVTRHRMWTHPRGPLEIRAAHAETAAPSGSSSAPIADYQAAEFPCDEAFWTADRVWTLGLLEAQAAP